MTQMLLNLKRTMPGESGTFFRVAHRLTLLLFSICIAAGCTTSPQRNKPHRDPPNILFIVADDLGLETVGAYGGQSYRTPNIDRLAENGLRFTHAFSNPYCSPSRAQLLTGRYPMHNGIRRVIFDPEKHPEFLDPSKEVSFARLLQKRGYETAIAGKWQVSFLHRRDVVREHGFDEYQCWQIFHDGEKTPRYKDPVFRRNGTVLDDELKGRYGPDVNVEFLKEFMRRNRDGPFLAYYTALLPHWPWSPTPDSDTPLKHMKKLGDKRYFPDMVAYLDKLVGRLVDELEDLGIRDETLVLFTGDNGTDRRLTSRWSNGRVTRTVPGGKGRMKDTGIRVPLIASWPGEVPAGRVNHDLIDFSDVLPTFADLAGADVPEKLNVDGRSFAPQLRGKPGNPRNWICVQDKNRWLIRNRRYILYGRGKTNVNLRPVEELGRNLPADPISPPLTEEQKAALSELRQALNRVRRQGK